MDGMHHGFMDLDGAGEEDGDGEEVILFRSAGFIPGFPGDGGDGCIHTHGVTHIPTIIERRWYARI